MPVQQIILCCYRHFMHRNLTSMNFDNPVYRKTTEDQFSLEKNLPARMYPSTVDEEVRTLTRDHRDCMLGLR